MSGNPNRADLNRRDLEALSQDPRFLRFLFTVLDAAGIYASTYGSRDHLAFAEGRRSLGFDMLRTVEMTRPDAQLAVLQAEHQALTCLLYTSPSPRDS